MTPIKFNNLNIGLHFHNASILSYRMICVNIANTRDGDRDVIQAWFWATRNLIIVAILFSVMTLLTLLINKHLATTIFLLLLVVVALLQRLYSRYKILENHFKEEQQR